MKQMTKEKAEEIYRRVALQNQATVDEIKKQIKLAMIVGMCNQDPAIQRRWSEIPHDGEVLSPEELLIYLDCEMRNSKRGSKA